MYKYDINVVWKEGEFATLEGRSVLTTEMDHDKVCRIVETCLTFVGEILEIENE